MDSVAAMQVFVRVVETGGLSAAGRALGLAPSSVSRRVGELEHALGVRLLQRTTRRLSLTEAGETYYERARDILRAVDEANLAVTAKRAGPSGVLRLTVPASIARQHIAPAVAAFQQQYSAVQIVMLVTDRVADVVGEGLDLALRVGQLEDSSLIARKVGQARRVVCASPAYLRSAGEPAHPADLTHHACVIFRTHPGVNLWRFRRGDEHIEVRVTGTFFSDDGEALAAAACAGLGIVLIPEWLVGADLSSGRLVELLCDFAPEPATTALHALYAPGPYVPPKVRAFVDFLAGRFSPAYDWSEQP
ncbi:MAG: LysR family transcriptional regulator [Pseudomonadota bacterium]